MNFAQSDQNDMLISNLKKSGKRKIKTNFEIVTKSKKFDEFLNCLNWDPSKTKGVFSKNSIAMLFETKVKKCVQEELLNFL